MLLNNNIFPSKKKCNTSMNDMSIDTIQIFDMCSSTSWELWNLHSPQIGVNFLRFKFFQCLTKRDIPIDLWNHIGHLSNKIRRVVVFPNIIIKQFYAWWNTSWDAIINHTLHTLTEYDRTGQTHRHKILVDWIPRHITPLFYKETLTQSNHLIRLIKKMFHSCKQKSP